MLFSGFSNEDFDLFKIEGLEPRMEELIRRVRPKLDFLGNHFTPSLTALTGQEMFAHIAKHARRTVNPPNDTWVAFANNKRGYKMRPHFQIGLWESHLFIWFAVIYECPEKLEIGNKLKSNIDRIFENTPENFYWSIDHTKPEALSHQQLSKKDLSVIFKRLQEVKKAEILCGYQIPREQAVEMSSEELLNKIDWVFNNLIQLYDLSYK